MDIDPRRLQILRAVDLRGGVGDAARQLNLTPSAVSQQLAQFELEVGLPLFDRSQRRIALTEAGRLLAARAERVEAELSEARKDLAALGGRLRGRVRLAAFATSLRALAIPTLEALEKAHPALRLEVVELEGKAALKALHGGEVDLALSEQDEEDPEVRLRGLTFHLLLEEGYRVVVPEAWGEPRSIRELKERPWIVGAPGCASLQALSRLGNRHRFKPQAAHACLEFPSMLALVAAGRGAAVVPELALAGGTQGARITALRVPGSRRIGAWGRAPLPTPEPKVRASLRVLEDVARQVRADLRADVA